MHITVDASLTGAASAELEVARGTPVALIAPSARTASVWCGPVELDPTHRAGEWPLVAGARLTAGPWPSTAPPRGTHVAVIAGPDAGAVEALAGPLVIGRGAQSGAGLGIADDTLNSCHAVVTPRPSGGATVRDVGTVNGTTLWSHTDQGLRRGRRARTATVRPGDVIEMGRTRVSLRDGVHRPAAMPELPDPTSPGSWTASTWIDGPFAASTARAVILARGRRPPRPADFAEPWWQWLPPAHPGDGDVWLGGGERREGGTVVAAVRLTAQDDRTVVIDSTGERSAPPVRVSASTAERLARAIAGAQPEALPTAIRWADLEQGGRALHAPPSHPPYASPSRWCVAAGLGSDGVWRIDLDGPAPHIAVTGGPGTGRTTLLATVTAGLAFAHAPSTLDIIALSPRDPGPMRPCLTLPHVRTVATCEDPERAAAVLAQVVDEIANRQARGTHAESRRVLVVADDIDAYGPARRRLWAMCDVIARDGARQGVTLAVATSRPTAVLSPSLRARVGTMVALGGCSEAESIELLGVATAAHLPGDLPGRAVVRAHGLVQTVHVALPMAEPTPPVRPHGTAPPQGKHLADACARDD